MSAGWLPTLAGIARLRPTAEEDTPTDVGASWTATVFTVPDGRILALDWALVSPVGGLLPNVVRLDAHDAAGTISARLIRHKPAALNDTGLLTNTVWFAETWDLRFNIEGGDATTDIHWSITGRLFDWVEVG